ncbi:MAG TPA: NFACT RNA binding domain-containing protein [Candidatus Deferrimicrobiaceae bacterium]|jgi:predicted ribosome quality control (RQC) complex YloA/Tae2 family protein
MDSFLVRQVVSELSRELPGALVSKVHQPSARDLVLVLWTGRADRLLLLSADPALCRIHLVARKPHNPQTPLRFCRYLRRHLEGMRIERFDLAPFDRSVRIDFASTRTDALHARTSLYAELFGRHANLIYVDGDGTILEPLRAVPTEESAIREVAAGVPYRPLPKPARIFLPEFSLEDAESVLAAGRLEGAGRALQRVVTGLGRELADEAAAAGGDDPAGLLRAVRDLSRRYESGESRPCIGMPPSGKARLLPFPCPAAGFVSFESFPSANEAADRFFGGVTAERDAATLRQQIASRLGTLLRKARHTLEKVEGDEARLREGLAGGAHGETLKYALGQIRKGMTDFQGVPLDPSKSPVENMERYFRLAKKAKGAAGIVRNRLRDLSEEVFYLESLEAQLAEAETIEALMAIRQELTESISAKGHGGSQKAKPKTVKAKPAAPLVPQVERIDFRGWTLFVGRNNVGNDRIVRELASPDDLWLHAQGIPGSHVLVKRPAGAEVPAEVIEEAARLAVLHSKARGSSNVPVFLAAARDVSKFKGAKPGLVRIASYTTINVR